MEREAFEVLIEIELCYDLENGYLIIRIELLLSQQVFLLLLERYGEENEYVAF